MPYIFGEYAFIINKSDNDVIISVMHGFIKFEKNIILEDLSNSMTLDKFNSFIIKCLERKENYNIELINNNNENLSINFSLKIDEFDITQKFILNKKELTENEKEDILIIKLKQEVNKLKQEIIQSKVDKTMEIQELKEQNSKFIQENKGKTMEINRLIQ